MGNRILNATRNTSPSTSSEHGVSNSLSLGSKANNLLENSLAIFVHCTTGLEHHRSEIVVRLLEGWTVTLGFLAQSIRFAVLDC